MCFFSEAEQSTQFSAACACTGAWRPRLMHHPVEIIMPEVEQRALRVVLAPVASSGLERRVVVVDGVERTYLVSGATATGGIVLCLHGSRSTAARQALFSGMGKLRPEGVVVVFPQAATPAGHGYTWDHERDVGYLASVIGETLRNSASSRSPVLLAGMSGGARMSCYYAAARATEIAAVAAVAGLRAPQVPPAQPVPVIAFHGLDDRLNPYAGGRSERWQESVPDAARAWAAANGVERTQTVSEPSPTLTKVTYGESTPAEVTLWTFRNAGHTWPGHPGGLFVRLLLGRTSNDLDATQEIWRFLAQARGTPSVENP